AGLGTAHARPPFAPHAMRGRPAREPRARRRARPGEPDRGDGALALPRIRDNRRARQGSAGVGTSIPRRRRRPRPRRSHGARPPAGSTRDPRPAARRRGAAPPTAGRARLPAPTGGDVSLGGDVIKPLPIADRGPYFR